MSDESNTDAKATAEAQAQKDSNSAPSKNTPETIPYERFSEVNAANKKLEAELKTFKANQQKAEEEAARQKGEFEKLYNENLPKIQGYEELSKTLADLLETQKQSIPEDKRGLIPSDYPPHKQLDWINANRAILVPSNSTKNPPVQPTNGTEGKVLHKASDIQNFDYYQKNAEDIKRALSEGRIVD